MATLNVGTLQAILELRDTMSSGLDNAAKKMRRFGGQMTRIGSNFTKAISLPLIAAGGAAIKFAVNFNKAMANIATLIPGNIERVQELKQAVQGMAVELGASTDDLAAGLYQVISAFGDSSESVKILEINARAATAGLATTTDAINLTSAITKGYGDTTADAVQSASDLMFTVVRLGQTSFPELAASLGKVVPLAVKMNITQAELGAIMATLTGVTGNASEVSTQFGAALSSLMTPTPKLVETIKELEFQTAEAMVGQLGFVGSLNALIGATDGSTQSVGELLGSKEALVAAFALTGAQAETFTDKLGEMADIAGATDEAFNEQTQGINAAGFAFQQFKQQVIVVMQNLGDSLVPALRDVLRSLDPVIAAVDSGVKQFANLSESTRTVIIQVAALAAVLGPLAVVVGHVTLTFGQLWPFLKSGGKLFGRLGPKVKGFGSSVARLASPMGLAITAFALLYSRSENFRRIVHALTKLIAGAVIGTFKGLWSVIGAVIEKVQTIAGAVMDKLAPAFQFVERLFGKAADALETFTDDGVQPAKKATAALTDELEVLVPDLEDVETVGEAAADSVAALGSSFTTLGVSVKRARDNMLHWLNVQERRLNVSARNGMTMLGRFADSWTFYGVEGKAATRGVGTALDHLSQNYRMAGLDALRLKDGAKMLNDVFNLNKISSEKAVSGLSNFKASLLGLRQGITGGNGIMGAMTKVGTGFSEMLGGLMTGGLSSLMSMGTQLAIKGLQRLGPVLKTGFKRIWGGIKGFFGKDAEGDIRKIGKRFGFALSGEMSSAIAHTAKEIGDKHTAFLLHLGEITEAQGGVMATGFQKVARTGRDLFSMVELGKITTTQAMRALGPVLKNLAANFDDAGAAGQLQFQELIQVAIKFGVSAEEIIRLVGKELADDAINGKLNPALIDAAGNVRKLNGEIAKIPTQIDIDAEVHYQTRQERQRHTGGMGGYNYPSFRHGTGGQFVNFGSSGTPAMLHGFERITPLADASRELADLAEVNARLGSIERLLKDQPRAMQLAFSDSLSMVR